MKKKYLVYLVILGSLLISGCGGFSLPIMPTPKQPQTVYNWEEIQTSSPQAICVGDEVYVVNSTEKTIKVNYEKQEKQLTFMGRLGAWIGGLGLIGVILLIVGLVLAPGATIGFLFSTLAKWKSAMKQTVSALKTANVVNENKELKEALKSSQSVQTKKIVGDIKAEL